MIKNSSKTRLDMMKIYHYAISMLTLIKTYVTTRSVETGGLEGLQP